MSNQSCQPAVLTAAISLALSGVLLAPLESRALEAVPETVPQQSSQQGSTASGQSAAEDEDEDEEVFQEETQVELDERIAEEQLEDRMVVTGSRISRAEFSSASPIQVISGQISRELGLFDTARILQESTVATGVQIDNTFGGFVLDNGPGAATLSFRNLGADRTLILLNGRRLGPSGVEGAPSAPNLNTIPSSLLARAENILDGASSIYGSDAVAGVSNIILRTDVDGFELETAFEAPEVGGGRTSRVSALWGLQSSKGHITTAAEFFRRNPMTIGDRFNNKGCNEHQEIDENGQRRNLEVDLAFGTTRSTCKRERTVGRVFNPFGSVWITPGETNINFPNFSEDQDLDGDGLVDVDLNGPLLGPATNLSHPDREEFQDAHFIQPLERISFFTFGEYEINPNVVPWFEFGFSQTDNTSRTAGAQIFPAVSPENPFNPCGVEGVFCEQERLQNIFGPDFTQQDSINAGFADLVPIFRIPGDRNVTKNRQTVTRFVGGLKGDLPFFEGASDGIPWLDLKFWEYEVHGSFQRSESTAERFGIREDRLALSLNTTRRLPDGSIACGQDLDGDGLPDGFDSFDQANGFGFFTDDVGCVPIDPFSERIMLRGELTPEEEEFLFGVRSFDTTLEQRIISGFISGIIGEAQGGPVGLALGFERRQDFIESRPDDTAEDGGLIGFFSDRGASGKRDLLEFFGEIEIPLLRDLPMADELILNTSGRYTDEANFGTAWTWSSKLFWKPVDWLTGRATRGTSFRAPNLREQFFKGSTGFISGFTDPCVVPNAAQTTDPDTGEVVRDPSLDNRTQQTFDNCQLVGVDPFTLGLGGVSSIEQLTGGTTELEEETSRSWTGGVVIDVPFDKFGGAVTDALSLQLSATYFDIEITDSVEEPSAGFIFNDCFVTNPNLNSGFCERIDRNPDTGIVRQVDASFINVGTITARGYDMNLLAAYDGLEFGGDVLRLQYDLTATRATENIFEVLTTTDDDLGEIAVPEWRAQGTLIGDWRNWRLLWRTRYIGEQDQDGNEEFVQGDTCQGFIEFGVRDETDVLCKNIDSVGSYFVHNASLTWRDDLWSVSAGVNNVFDNDPPKVDSAVATTSSAGNFPLGVGYDLFGRTYQFSIQRRF